MAVSVPLSVRVEVPAEMPVRVEVSVVRTDGVSCMETAFGAWTYGARPPAHQERRGAGNVIHRRPPAVPAA
nr:hypothetical protein KitaXyl93_63150 [Kitasatospora sp. Xyl93]